METKVLLQSFDKHSEKACLDIITGDLKKLSLLQNISSRDKHCSGRYSMILGGFACLYKVDGIMFFQYRGCKYEITANTLSRITSQNDMNRFQLLQEAGNIMLEFVYNPPTPNPPLHLDPTPFTELEDFDFMVFVKNVINDTSRQERIF